MKKLLFLFAILWAILPIFGVNAYAANGDLIVNGNFNLLPAGTIVMHGGSMAPTGWLLADGSAVSRTTYATLFAAIGTTYGGGDGSATFNVPNFGGVFPKGTGSQIISNISYTGTLGTKSTDRMQGHKHASGWYGPRGAAGTASVFATNASTYPSVNTGDPLTDGMNGTPRTGATTEPQSLGVNFIIKF